MPNTRIVEIESSDAELITAVRGGDTAAYGLLFDRHHGAATALARQLVPGPDAGDLVAESFIRVLAVLQSGKGPDEFFRAYLLTALRRLHIDQIRQQKRVRPTGDQAELDRAVEFVDPAALSFEQGAAAAAFASLPERWQLVLWHLDVEGQKPADIAPLLAMSANSVSALAYRAREGLRQAYLQSHLAPTLHESCHRTTGLLGAYVRKGLSARDTSRVEEHLDECSRCTGIQLELADINSGLSGLLGPALLGSAATGYLAASGTGALVGAGVAAGTKGLVGTVTEALLAPFKVVGGAVSAAGTNGVVAAAVVVAVGTAGAVAVTSGLGGKDAPSTSSAPRTSPAPPSPSTAEPSTPQTTAEPPPTSTSAPVASPRPVSVADPAPPPLPEPGTDPAPEPAAKSVSTPEIEPVTPTDYGIAGVRVTNDSTILQRRITVHVTASNSGRPADEIVSITMSFRRPVVFRGVASPGWACGPAVRNQRLRTLTCTSRLDAGRGTTFVVKAIGLLPRGTVVVSAPGDPVSGNDSATFRSGVWPLT